MTLVLLALAAGLSSPAPAGPTPEPVLQDCASGFEGALVSRSGKWLVTAPGDVFDLARHLKVATLPPGVVHGISPADELVLYQPEQGQLEFRQLPDLSVVRSSGAPPGEFWSLAPDGRALVLLSEGTPGLYLWSGGSDLELLWENVTRTPLLTWKAAFSPDSTRLALQVAAAEVKGSEPSTSVTDLMVWDLSSRKKLGSLKLPGPVQDLEFAPSGEILCLLSDRLLELKLPQGTLREAPLDLPMDDLALSPDGTRLVTWGTGGGRVFDRSTLQSVQTFPEGPRLCGFDAAGNLVRVLAGLECQGSARVPARPYHETPVVLENGAFVTLTRYDAVMGDTIACLWDPGQVGLVRSWNLAGRTERMARSGNRLFWSGGPEGVWCLDLTSDGPPRVLRKAPVFLVAVSPDGKQLATIEGVPSYDEPRSYRVCLLDAASGKLLRSFPLKELSEHLLWWGSTLVCQVPGRLLGMSSTDGKVVWKTGLGPGMTLDMVLTGDRLAVLGDGVNWFDARGKKLGVWNVGGASLAALPGGGLLVSDGEHTHCWAAGKPGSGIPAGGQSAALDEHRVLVARTDRMELWDLAAGKQATLAVFPPHFDPGWASLSWVLWTPDGSFTGTPDADRLLWWPQGGARRDEQALKALLGR